MRCRVALANCYLRNGNESVTFFCGSKVIIALRCVIAGIILLVSKFSILFC